MMHRKCYTTNRDCTENGTCTLDRFWLKTKQNKKKKGKKKEKKIGAEVLFARICNRNILSFLVHPILLNPHELI